jgi:hypothetical protein
LSQLSDDVPNASENRTAILDRLLHHAVTLNICGNSYRLKEKLKALLVRSAGANRMGNFDFHTGES